MDHETQKVTLRIPADLYAQIKKLAKEHDRSANNLIALALREYLRKQTERPIF